MTLKQMRSKLWWMAGMKDGGDIPTALWDLHLNEAQEKLCEVGLIVDKWATCSSVAEQRDYLLPSYVLELKRVYVYDDDNTYYKPIPATTIDDLNKRNTDWKNEDSATIPDFYYQEGLRLGFHPMFDAAVTDGIMIEYLRLGDTLSDDDDESKIRTHYHKYVVIEAFVLMFPNHPDSRGYKEELAQAYGIMSHRILRPDSAERVIRKPAS